MLNINESKVNAECECIEQGLFVKHALVKIVFFLEYTMKLSMIYNKGHKFSLCKLYQWPEITWRPIRYNQCTACLLCSTLLQYLCNQTYGRTKPIVVRTPILWKSIDCLTSIIWKFGIEPETFSVLGRRETINFIRTPQVVQCFEMIVYQTQIVSIGASGEFISEPVSVSGYPLGVQCAMKLLACVEDVECKCVQVSFPAADPKNTYSTSVIHEPFDILVSSGALKSLQSIM